MEKWYLQMALSSSATGKMARKTVKVGNNLKITQNSRATLQIIKKLGSDILESLMDMYTVGFGHMITL
tara:strand:+ start:73 stop:276 length:204 start_codon:yes stop_codon:yes gene_type:complete